MLKKINIDKQIDEHRCPGVHFCTVATTGYTAIKREHLCYICWLQYCRENRIEITYGDEVID